MGDGDITADLVCECGNKFTISIAGKELESLDLPCPACGKVDRLTPEQITAIKSAYDQRVAEINAKLKSIADKSKFIQYRPKG